MLRRKAPGRLKSSRADIVCFLGKRSIDQRRDLSVALSTSFALWQDGWLVQILFRWSIWLVETDDLCGPFLGSKHKTVLKQVPAYNCRVLTRFWKRKKRLRSSTSDKRTVLGSLQKGVQLHVASQSFRPSETIKRLEIVCFWDTRSLEHLLYLFKTTLFDIGSQNVMLDIPKLLFFGFQTWQHLHMTPQAGLLSHTDVSIQPCWLQLNIRGSCERATRTTDQRRDLSVALSTSFNTPTRRLTCADILEVIQFAC